MFILFRRMRFYLTGEDIKQLLFILSSGINRPMASCDTVRVMLIYVNLLFNMYGC